MALEKQNLLFLARSTQHGGTENVILQLCNIFNSHVNKIIVCSAKGFRIDLLASLGIKHYTIEDLENKSPAGIISIFNTLNKIISEEKITIVHTHHRMAAFYAKLLSYKYDFMIINTAHNTFYDKKIMTKFIYSKMNIVACGNKVKENLVKYFHVPASHIEVIHNAIEEFGQQVVFDEKISEMHLNGKYIIGNIGRLSKQKGMEYYIKSIPMVIKKHPEARFLVIGSGEDEEQLKGLAESLNIKDYILFLGYCENPRNIMCQIDIIVLSSLWEGLPLTPIEAFSVGRTVIGTSVDGTTEVIEHMKSGILIPPQNSVEIAEKIIWLIEHPKEKRKMEENAYLRYKQEFSFEKFSECYISYYKQCCGFDR